MPPGLFAAGHGCRILWASSFGVLGTECLAARPIHSFSHSIGRLFARWLLPLVLWVSGTCRFYGFLGHVGMSPEREQRAGGKR